MIIQIKLSTLICYTYMYCMAAILSKFYESFNGENSRLIALKSQEYPWLGVVSNALDVGDVWDVT